MTHEIKHSPPPWSIGLDKFGRPTYIKADGNRIAQTLSTPETKTAEKRIANAEHIVKCVNENESLHARIKELEKSLSGIANYAGQYMGCRCAVDDCEPGDCWQCRMMDIIGQCGEPFEKELNSGK